MLTIEEYIASRKKKDKMDEFNFQNHSENMGKIIQYVTEYFNEYLNLEDYNYEQVKMQQSIDKFKASIKEHYPTMYEFIIEYYRKNKRRIDTIVEKTYCDIEDSELFYLPEDDKKVAEFVCTKKLKVGMNEDFISKLSMISKEYRELRDEMPDISEMKELDNVVVDWVRDVYKVYHADLFEFAYNISEHYYKVYVDVEYNRNNETIYHINKYDYRYQNNPFNINEIYERNKHRAFIENHKGELEMLIMYCWLFYEVEDQDYWPEYVNLSISRGRVSLAEYKRILNPVIISNLKYPCDISANIYYIEITTGILMNNPGEKYILQIVYEKGNDVMWRDKEALEKMIKNLQTSFKKYGAPQLLEFLSPYKTLGFEEEEFFANYQIFENRMKRFNKMKIAIINGYMKKNKGKEFLISTIDDIMKLRNICREMKLKLKLSVDFTDPGGRNNLKKNILNMINSLSSIRTFIAAIHINAVDTWGEYKNIYKNDTSHEYFSFLNYQTLSKFLSGLSTILQDGRTRYFIPNTVKKSDSLETLVDMLIRGGFYFESGVGSNEE